MSHLKYHAYEGTGQHNLEAYHYNQAVRIPAGADRVELAGQGTTESRGTTKHTINDLNIRRLGPQIRRGARRPAG